MDDRTIGLVLRALRRRRGWRQSDLAAAAGCSQALVSRVEAGHVGSTTVETLRKLFLAVEARLALTASWRGAELDRLLDQDHADLGAAFAERLERWGWSVELEVTYAEYGERGSIDVLALRPDRRAALVVELKTDVASAEALGRKLDEKVRLVPVIVRKRHGWMPESVGRVVVFPESSRLRRLVESTPAIKRMLPAEPTGLRRWLREPAGGIAGVWFLSAITPRHVRRRIRRPASIPPPGSRSP